MTADVAISVRGLGKCYRRGKRGSDIASLRETLQSGLVSLFRRKGDGPGAESGEFWALKNANFDIAHGENVGIIGLNGAGKSTLLKLLSRITTPTTGTGRVNGRLGALLEVGTGFNRELTGRENVFLYGSILGMTQQEIAKKFDAIVEFSEIAEFIDTPVKQYSSGMYVRLAFSVAAHLDPDILILDEVLAVGDFTFQKKCIDFTKSLEKKGATILFVSHNMFSIKTMCNRVIYLKHGEIAFDGPVDEGLKRYEADCRLATAPWFHPEDGLPRVKITDVTLLDEAGVKRSLFDFGERMKIRVEYDALDAVEHPNVLIAIMRDDFVHCSSFSSAIEGLELGRISGRGAVELTTPPLKLISDKYTLQVIVREDGFARMLNAQIGGSFHVKHKLYSETVFGVFYEPGTWRIAHADEGKALEAEPLQNLKVPIGSHSS
jgi:lipopolysaccharide transport system ATP-binding protein